jgi:hypothetical protein
MMTTPTMTLRALFSKLDELPGDHTVYLPASGKLALDTESLVLDPDDMDPDEDIPPEAVQKGFTEGLGIADVRSIRDNAKLQGKAPTDDELLEAFAYYLAHDAFITFK